MPLAVECDGLPARPIRRGGADGRDRSDPPSDGRQPLFVDALIESWRAAGVLVEQGRGGRGNRRGTALAVPELRAFIEGQVRRLRLDGEVLEAAGLVGAEISPVIVASALERPLTEVETVCLHLSRIGQFIRPAGTLEYPDGTVTDR